MRSILFVLLVSELLAGSAFAKQCSQEDAKAADVATATLKTWSEFYVVFHRYGHCDNGGPGEGFSDSVVHLLASRWNFLPQAAAIARKDPGFRTFLLRHIDSTTDSDELLKIEKYAKTECPSGLRKLCRDIGKAATLAYRDL